MRASCLERLELLNSHNRQRRNYSDNIATNDDFLAAENGAMGQDETAISGKLTEISQNFPQGHKHMFHLQLNSKETFQCYYIHSRANNLERLVKRYGCGCKPN